jgi:C-terminal processing protease CtpA/Prc
MLCSIVGEPSNLSISDDIVAVLIGHITISSGEAVAVSFKGRANTKFFGNLTNGKSTGNRLFRLSNNAAISLTTTIMADRNKKMYGKDIKPDVYLRNPHMIKKEENDTTIISAMNWIKFNK